MMHVCGRPTYNKVAFLSKFCVQGATMSPHTRIRTNLAQNMNQNLDPNLAFSNNQYKFLGRWCIRFRIRCWLKFGTSFWLCFSHMNRTYERHK